MEKSCLFFVKGTRVMLTDRLNYVNYLEQQHSLLGYIPWKCIYTFIEGKLSILLGNKSKIMWLRQIIGISTQIRYIEWDLLCSVLTAILIESDIQPVRIKSERN